MTLLEIAKIGAIEVTSMVEDILEADHTQGSNLAYSLCAPGLGIVVVATTEGSNVN